MKSALERHISRFQDDGEKEKHSIDRGGARRATARRTGSMVLLRDRSICLDGDSEIPVTDSASTASALSPALSPVSPPTRSPSPTYCFAQSPLAPTSGAGQNPVRLLLIRHAQSANKDKRPGEKSVSDPDLSDFGYEQAELLGERLLHEFASVEKGDVIIVSSPMRRCLQTIRPAVRQLKLPLDYCFCHGACYEYRCAGNAFTGSSDAEIAREFPEFRPVGFNDAGTWDYVGCNDKETEQECRARALRIVEWLQAEAAMARSSGTGPTRTLVLTIHQTMADLLCHILLRGDSSGWIYGEVAHKLHNASMTTLWLSADGSATLGKKNDAAHLLYMGSPQSSFSGSLSRTSLSSMSMSRSLRSLR